MTLSNINVMVKHFFTSLAIFISFHLSAQLHVAPNQFNYTAVARDTSGKILVNQNIAFKISILKGNIMGSLQYSELQNIVTDSYGLFTFIIGAGNVLSGSMNTIKWGSDKYYLQIALTLNAGHTFQVIETSELLSVPYALHSTTADSLSDGVFYGDYNRLRNKPIVIKSMSNNRDTLYLSDGRTFIDKTSVLPGSIKNQLLYWNGSSWIQLNPGINGQNLIICDGTLTWANKAMCVGKINSLECDKIVNPISLEQGIFVSGLTIEIPYTGGNNGWFTDQILASTGVIGLTATIKSGRFMNGNGTLTVIISGKPKTAGTANFIFSIGGQSCSFNLTVTMVNCTGSSTEIVTVTNPKTGRTWMDRNLGATRAATNMKDANAFGDLYQWGRESDGHQCRFALKSLAISSSDHPGHNKFIINNSGNYDWRNTQNDNLWQGVNGANNPCPNGYRLPTDVEFDDELKSWIDTTENGEFKSVLRLPFTGIRTARYGTLESRPIGALGFYWSSSVNGTNSIILYFGERGIYSLISTERANGCSVRCIKD